MTLVAEQLIEAIATGEMPPQIRRSIRAYPAVIDGQQRRIVICAGCGDSFTVSSRTVRLARQQHRELYCPTCRRPAEVKVTLVHRSYWLSVWTLPEIIQCAEMIWGPRAEW